MLGRVATNFPSTSYFSIVDWKYTTSLDPPRTIISVSLYLKLGIKLKQAVIHAVVSQIIKLFYI